MWDWTPQHIGVSKNEFDSYFCLNLSGSLQGFHEFLDCWCTFNYKALVEVHWHSLQLPTVFLKNQYVSFMLEMMKTNEFALGQYHQSTPPPPILIIFHNTE